MGLLDSDRKIKECEEKDEGGFSCDIEVNGEKKRIKGNTPSKIADKIAREGITSIDTELPGKLKRDVELATKSEFQNELDELEEKARKRRIMDERIKDFPEQEKFLGEIKNLITQPKDKKIMKDIGISRIGKVRSEKKEKEL